MSVEKPDTAPPPLSREDWCAEFMDALASLRTGLGLKYMRTVALNQYDAKLNPTKAAKSWAERK